MNKVLPPVILPASLVVSKRARSTLYARVAQISVAVMVASVGAALSLQDVLIIHAMWGLAVAAGLVTVGCMWLVQVMERDYGEAEHWQLVTLAQLCDLSPPVRTALDEVAAQHRAMTFKEADAILKSEEKQ